MRLLSQFEMIDQLVTAAAIVRKTGFASNEHLREKLCVHPDAATLIGQSLERLGLVGPRRADGGRDVYTIDKSASAQSRAARL